MLSHRLRAFLKRFHHPAGPRRKIKRTIWRTGRHGYALPQSGDCPSAVEILEHRWLLTATPTVLASDAGGTYNGSPYPATATATGSDGASVSGSFSFAYYSGSTVSGIGLPNPPSNAGTYTVVANFTSSNPDYTNAQSAPVTFTIGQATPYLTVSDPSGPYTGNSYLATDMFAGVVPGVDNTPKPVTPGLNFSTYLGGSSADYPTAVATDAAGDTYLVGYTLSTDFPVTPGSFETTFQAPNDVAGFVAKFAPNGDLLWSTLLQGSSDTVLSAVAVDSSQDVFVGGTTYSAGYPTTPGAFAATFDGYSPQGAITELNPNGTALDYSTYLPGGAVTGIAVDNAGHVYATGYSFSDLPTKNAFQSSPGGDGDAFVTVLNLADSSLVYSTYLGGSGSDIATGIAIDASGDAYIAGTTSSTNFPTMNAFQPAYGGGSSNAFVAKLGPSGNLIYSTYLGGSVADMAGGVAVLAGPGGDIAVDAAGDAYVIGSTDSPNFPTVNAQEPTYQGGSGDQAINGDAFVSELNPTGSALVRSTFLGGSGGERGTGIALDQAGNVYVCGVTGSTNFPIEGEFGSNLELSNSNNEAGFVAELSSSDWSMVYSTYVGSIGPGFWEQVAVDPSGGVHIAGATDRSIYPIVNAYQSTYAGNDDAIVQMITSPVVTLKYYDGTTASGPPLFGAPSLAGTYTVVATYAGSQDYRSITASATFTIGLLTPTVIATDAGGAYTGNPYPATATATGSGGASVSGSFSFIYYPGNTVGSGGSSTAPSNAGTYTVVAFFTSSNPLYVNAESAPVTFTIAAESEAMPTVTVTDAGGTYNGNPYAAAGTVAGINGVPGTTLEGIGLTFTYYAGTTATGTLLSSAPANVGTYSVVASFPGSQDYTAASAQTTFTITPATPSVVATDAGGQYTGNPYPASASATGVGGVSVSGTFVFTYYVGTSVSGTGSSAAPSAAGTYTVVAAFTSSNPNDVNAQSLPVTFSITAAPIGVSAPSTATVYENGSLVFSVANGNAITLTDGVGSGITDSLTLAVTHGTLTLGSTTGLTVSSGSNGSALMTVIGTLSSLNAALAGLTYTPLKSYTGSDLLQISISDPGDSQSATATVSVQVAATTPPTLTYPTGLVRAFVSTQVVFNGTIYATDPSAGKGIEQLALSATHGVLTLGSTTGITIASGANSSAAMTITGTLANINTALKGLVFSPTPGYIGTADVSISYTDLGDGLTASGTVILYYTRILTTGIVGSVAIATPTNVTSTASTGSPSVATNAAASEPTGTAAPQTDEAEDDPESTATQWSGLTAAIAVLNG